MRHLTTALVLALALGAAACGDDGSSSDSSKAGAKYPDSVRARFLDSCDQQANAKRSTCECALDKIEQTVSYDDFKAADEAIRKDPNARPPGYDKLKKAAEDCARQQN